MFKINNKNIKTASSIFYLGRDKNAKRKVKSLKCRK